ncbi:MAG: DUF262 domain-containing protein [Acidobacteria bacterium]|nr:DUF262 domain-containing protein [Acidobacteriota bacterium]
MANLLNTRTIDFMELIGNGRFYQVPPYQRDYSWAEEQWEDLWNDIVELRDQPSDRHYMGALVVEGVSDREFQVIDGQQRLATLSIFALAVIGELQHLAEQGTDPDANTQRADGLRARFVGDKDPASLVESSRLRLNETDDDFFQEYLVQLRKPLSPGRLPKSNRLLWSCYIYFKGRLRSQPELLVDGQTLAGVLSETVARQLLFILITVDDALNAYTVFETLNARGLELTTTDLLKNHLFSRVPVRADLESLQRRWKPLLDTVQQSRFPEFLRYHLLCELPKIRSRRLFKVLRQRAKSAPEVFHLVGELEKRAELFAAVLDPNHEYWGGAQAQARRHVRELNQLRTKQMMPMLFAAWEALPEAFDSILRIAAVISFRYMVSELNTNELEPVYHRAAKAILDGRATSPSSVFRELKEIYVDDQRMESDFARRALSPRGVRKKLVKHILARLESDASGRDCDPETDPGTIEHVLPESPSDSWIESFGEERTGSMITRLGNLTLLEASSNRKIQNFAYREKVQVFADSAYSITQEIAEMAPEEWTPVLIEERQRRLAKRAVHLWRCDFD